MIRRLLMVLSLGAAMSVATAACNNPAGSPTSEPPLVETVAPSDLPVAPSDSMLPSDSPLPSAS